MKPFVVVLLVLNLAFTGGTIFYFNHIAPPLRIPGLDLVPNPALVTTASDPTSLPPLPLPQTMATQSKLPVPAKAPMTLPADQVAPVNPATNHISQAVDTLVSPQTSFAQKRALLQKLHDAGELDQVIGELKQRVANHPNDASLPTALGEAYLSKFPVEDYNDAAILGMQVDQSFNTALKLDPANWEAQYYKAAAMSYWPAAMNKGPEVIERLANLIDQQEASPRQQPEYAQTYAQLGDQYLKAGQPDYAQQTWRLGAARFPNDAGLKMKLGGR